MIAFILLLLCSLVCGEALASPTPQRSDSDALCIAARLRAGYGMHDSDSFGLHKKRTQRIYDYDDLSTSDSKPKRAIVIGASIGMGRELSKMLAADGYIVGMTARRVGLLEEIQQEIPTQTYVAYMDASKPEEAVEQLNSLITQMGGLDLLVIAVTGFWDCDFENRDWQKSLSVLTVDVVGFFALARTGLNFFEDQGYGHLVGFSSIDGLHGNAACQAYSASKAFCSRYLEAERNKFIQKNMPVHVTDICPGWVNSKGDVDFTQMPQAYWVESLDDATKEIFEAIKNKERIAYITKRWQKVAELLAIIPNDLYNALSGRPAGGF